MVKVYLPALIEEYGEKQLTNLSESQLYQLQRELMKWKMKMGATSQN